MKKILFLTAFGILLLVAPAFATGPDDFVGDTAIYGGETATVKPNLLIIFDTSGSMGQNPKIPIEVCAPDTDQDGDGVGDSVDNCPTVANADQADADGDGIGDACECSDTDGDGVSDDSRSWCAPKDNCPDTYNPDQKDSDHNGIGDACDVDPCLDSDGDGYPDVYNSSCHKHQDNCPTVYNPHQDDSNGNGVGDACDCTDRDHDGIYDNPDAVAFCGGPLDNCPDVYNPDQEDSNHNGTGDACEASGDYNASTDYTTSTHYCGDYSNHYDSYDSACDLDGVYYCSQSDWHGTTCTNWQLLKSNVNYLNDNCSNVNDHTLRIPANTIENTLKSDGIFTGKYYLFPTYLGSSCSSSNHTGHFATGNWINWYNLSAGGTIAALTNNFSGAKAYFANSQPLAATTSTTSALPLICTTDYKYKIEVARDVVTNLIETTSGLNIGLMIFSSDDQGSTFVTKDGYTTTIKEMTDANKTALTNIVQGLDAGGHTPLAESLFEAMRYFQGGSSAFHSNSYDSPISASCQQNYVVIITDGMSTSDDDSKLKTICNYGDCDGDGNDPGSFHTTSNGSTDYLDDVAYYLYHHDQSDTYAGTQTVSTYTIGFGLDGTTSDGTFAVQLLQDTADNGGGTYYSATNYSSLTGALTDIVGQILEVNSAFVAPVVPTSPENRTYSAQRVYLGFFKPIQNSNWKGNLKKYGLSNSNQVVDADGNVATDDTGSFLDSAKSYWSTSNDGANVDQGGAGALLLSRTDDSNPRHFYTYTYNGTGTDDKNLTDSVNSFTTGNTLLPDRLGVSADEATKIINYVHGYDAWDEDLDGNTSEMRKWVLGDILHSRPLIQAYAHFDATADEDDPTKNLSVIYVGSNDGQFHAFRDADGEELWSFIPPGVLPDMQYLSDNIHQYFVDGSPAIWTYDHDNDGDIGPTAEKLSTDTDPTGVTDNGDKDKAILLFGMRRGEGLDNLLGDSTSRGAYYALNVTDPTAPQYLWRLDSQTTGFGELGETWSEPVIGRMRLGNYTRIVAFIGAGYDNNEDMRYGNTQKFPDADQTTDTAGPEHIGANDPVTDTPTTSAATNTTQFQPKGRGIYLVELARIASDGTVTVNTTPTYLWSWVHTDARESSTNKANNPEFSFPSAISAVDTDFDGYIDTLYCGDTGGNMWRFDVKNKTSTSTWSGTKIFSANPSDNPVSGEDPATNGRKIFYPPSVTLEAGFNALFFGTGDRPHALNKAVTDRIYALFDPDLQAAVTESNMVDVTEDILQSDTSTGSTVTPEDVTAQLNDLMSSSKDGWFIRLDQIDGEKVLSPAVVFDKVAYYTTFSPNIETEDPCKAGNLGAGRTFALNYLTGEAVFDYDTLNDGSSTSNSRATTDEEGVILRRSDRVISVGSGIPSGVIIVCPDPRLNPDSNDEKAFALIGSGGGVAKKKATSENINQMIYWIQQ